MREHFVSDEAAKCISWNTKTKPIKCKRQAYLSVKIKAVRGIIPNCPAKEDIYNYACQKLDR